MFPGSAYPKEIAQQYTPATHTERSSALPEGPLGGLPSLPKAMDPSWGEGRQTSRQPTDASTPGVGQKCMSEVNNKQNISSFIYMVLKSRDCVFKMSIGLIQKLSVVYCTMYNGLRAAVVATASLLWVVR